MDSTGQLIHAAPTDQPASAHQIAERLYPAYTVDGGYVHLAGCRLEDRLFMRVEFRCGERSVAVYVDAEGKEVDAGLVDALGMTSVTELGRPPQPFEPDVEALTDAAVRIVSRRLSTQATPELLSTAILWCKYAEGKLRIEIGENAVDVPFAGWCRTLRPPPWVCGYAGCETFHLAATDDGRIADAEQIETCSETGRRVLRDELLTCFVSGRRAVSDLFRVCPVTGKHMLQTVMVTCDTCQQPVSPLSVQQNQCAACRNVRPVSKADPRMARLLDEHPPLDRWRSWRMSETATAYILTASGWLKRILVVADRESLELKLVATGNRLLSGWNVVPPSQHDYVLRE